MNDEVKDPTQIASSAMPFLNHLEELRWRLLKSILSVIVMSFVAFYFAEDLVKFIRIPLGDAQLYNMEVTGTFYAYLKIALVGGIMGALPIIFFQLWSFVAPGLYKHEKRMILPMVTISTILFIVGGGFCFVMVLPLAFKFLIGFSGEMVVNNITIGSYINFVGLLLIAFGFSFQLPVACYLLGKMGILTSSFLSKGRRYAIVIILIVGAIITPPDVFTQFLLAVPLYILYEISILVVWLTQKKKEERADSDAEADEQDIVE